MVLPAPKKRLWKGLVEDVVVVGGSLWDELERLPGPEETVVVVLVGGALDKYFCFISSAVNGAPVLLIPEPLELSEPVLESDDALLVPWAWVSADVLLQKLSCY